MTSIIKTALISGAALATFGLTAITANADTVTVKPGDTLTKIANSHNTTVNSLVSKNNIKNKHLIYVGQQLQTDDQTTYFAPTVKAEAPVQAPAPAPQVQATVQTKTAPVAETPSSTQAPTVEPVQATVQNNTVQTSDALQTLINRESSGNVNATNGQYYGLGQLSTQARAMYGGNSTDYNDQLNAMKSYISDRYGTAENALAHSNATGWY